MAIDFRACLYALSDVVINRPPPLRHLDQIYMKLPDMLLQAEHTGRWFDRREVVFIGDGDAIALSMVHLHATLGRDGRPLMPCGPARVKVLDFDERMVNSVNHFASRYQIADRISAELYNVADPLPPSSWRGYDAFYTNPPWGSRNDGASVRAFIRRGVEATRGDAVGCVVIGDHPRYPWTHDVLLNTQRFLLDHAFRVAEMLPEFHRYHLDDAPELTSCSLVVKRVTDVPAEYASEPLPATERANFYGAGRSLTTQYVRDRTNGGKLASRDVELTEVPS